MGGHKKYTQFYLYNIFGEYVGKYTDLELVEKLNIVYGSLRSAIFRKSCIGNLYYVSLDKNFVMPTKTTYSHNPTLSKMKSKDKVFRNYTGNLDFLDEYETHF